MCVCVTTGCIISSHLVDKISICYQVKVVTQVEAEAIIFK